MNNNTAMNMDKLLRILSDYWMLHEKLMDRLDKLGNKDIEMGNNNIEEVLLLCIEDKFERIFNVLFDTIASEEDKHMSYYDLCKKYGIKFK